MSPRDAATPILGGRRGRETLNALEKIKNTVLNEERSSHMRTLGAHHDFARGQPGRSTLDTKSRRRPGLEAVTSAFDKGFENGAFISRSSDEEEQETGSELRDLRDMAPSSDVARGRHRGSVSQM